MILPEMSNITFDDPIRSFFGHVFIWMCVYCVCPILDRKQLK